MPTFILLITLLLTACTESKTPTPATHTKDASIKTIPPPNPDPPKLNPLHLIPHTLTLNDGKDITLNIPEGYKINVVAKGLKRVRFMAKSPDGRIFVTDMYNKTDNTKGKVYILQGFDAQSGATINPVTWLSDLHNPNSLAFHTDSVGNHWLYLALTQGLLRYRYTPGELSPSSEPDTLARFPDYGLSYKYGGWHLTRTIAIGTNNKLYISVGSSCDACEEKENEVRAAIMEMDLDGKHQRIFARGLRNAVGMKWANDNLMITDMGSDFLGDNKPMETMYIVKDGSHYGWPYFYQYRTTIYEDSRFKSSTSRLKPKLKDVPKAFATFGAHSAPLGLEYFGANTPDPELRNSYLVALHGSTKIALKRGYSIVQVRDDGTVRDFITGFLKNGVIKGRPADIMSVGDNAFLVTDDDSGSIYIINN